MQQIQKKKICLIGDSLADGGAERVMADLSNYFFSKGIDIHIAIIQDKVGYPYSGNLLNLGLFQKPGAFNKIIRFFKLRSYLSEQNFDFVIDFRYKNNYLQEWFTNELIYDKKKIVFTIHSSILNYYIPDSNFLAKLVFRKAYGIVAVSDKIRDEVSKMPIGVDVKRIYNPVIKTYIDLCMQNEQGPDYKYILAAGSMDGDTKQFDGLIDTYAASNLPGKDVKLVILGKGKLKENYILRAKQMGLENKVVFPGFKNNPFVYMKNALFFVLSSKKEGLGMVLIESLACGTPVISFDCNSGPSEIVQNKVNGLLVKDQDFDELKKAMNFMVEDNELYVNCKKNAVGSIEKFMMDTIGKQWLQYLKIDN